MRCEALARKKCRRITKPILFQQFQWASNISFLKPSPSKHTNTFSTGPTPFTPEQHMALALLASPPPPLGLRRSFRTRCSLFAAQRAKRNLMELISDQDRGLRTQKDAAKRDAIVNAIESIAVIGRSSVTTGDSLSATWRLLWTTEKEQLFIIEKAGLFGTRAGDVLQVIDVKKGMLNNVITFPPDGVFFVRSDIDIASPQRVNFRFESVYMDGEMRVAKDIRGDYLIVDRAPFSWKE